MKYTDLTVVGDSTKSVNRYHPKFFHDVFGFGSKVCLAYPSMAVVCGEGEAPTGFFFLFLTRLRADLRNVERAIGVVKKLGFCFVKLRKGWVRDNNTWMGLEVHFSFYFTRNTQATHIFKEKSIL